MCFGGYNPFMSVVGSLKPGDEVIVCGLDHEGIEHHDEKVVVYQVHGYSFLTTSGYGFGAGVIWSLELTGAHFDNPVPSQKALAVLAEVESRRLAEEQGYEPTGDLQNFDPEPE